MKFIPIGLECNFLQILLHNTSFSYELMALNIHRIYELLFPSFSIRLSNKFILKNFSSYPLRSELTFKIVTNLAQSSTVSITTSLKLVHYILWATDLVNSNILTNFLFLPLSECVVMWYKYKRIEVGIPIILRFYFNDVSLPYLKFCNMQTDRLVIY